MSVYVLFGPFSSGAMSLLSIKKKKKRQKSQWLYPHFVLKQIITIYKTPSNIYIYVCIHAYVCLYILKKKNNFQ